MAHTERNYQNRTRNPRDRRFTNPRVQQPYTVNQNNENNRFQPRYPHNDYVQNHSYRNEDNVYKSFNYNRKEQYSGREHFKTNFYGHRDVPYDKHRRQYSNNHTNKNFFDSRRREQNPGSSYSEPFLRDVSPIPLSPQEAKTQNLINAVRSQEGIGRLLVFLQTDRDNPTTILQNAVQTIRNGNLSVTFETQEKNYELKINGEFIVKGEYINKQTAKNGLCELALDKLKKTCFFIGKKRNYEEISTEDINKAQNKETTPNNTMEGSKAHQMMLKMGWGGKGLGINEQGAEKTVAETMTQNVTKEGLGGKNIMHEINNILKEFAQSTKVTTLAFDSGFTKEERAHIHNLAAKLNLKSKSEGKEESRRITIGKKIARWDLVKELLLNDCENEAYKLTIPSDFEDMWTN